MGGRETNAVWWEDSRGWRAEGRGGRDKKIPGNNHLLQGFQTNCITMRDEDPALFERTLVTVTTGASPSSQLTAVDELEVRSTARVRTYNDP